MALPEHVKRLAMDAVNHKESTAQIRLLTSQNPEPAKSSGNGDETERPYFPKPFKGNRPDFANGDTWVKMIQRHRAMSVLGQHSHAASIARLHQAGLSVDAVHQQITKDDFGRGQ